jgi:hypothetical protein
MRPGLQCQPAREPALEVKHMVKRFVGNSVLILSIVAGAAACTTLQVHSDVNRSLFHAGQCHTFSWAGSFRENNPMRDTVANPLNESRLRAAITAHMQTIGVQFATSNADCLVGYGIGSHTVVEGGYPYGPMWGPGWGWGPYWGPGPWAWNGPYVYHEGVIGIDLYDANTREALWHASVDQDLYGATGADAEKRIDAAVDALFTKFPS